MAAATTAAPCPLADQVEAAHNTLMGHLELSPKFVCKFLDTECSDKKPNETFRLYLTRIRDNPFSNGEWKKLCLSLWKIFEKETGSSEMEMTALFCLFDVIFKVKNDNRVKSGFMSKLKALKDLRNDVMHNAAAATDPGAIGKLQNALSSFIQEAGNLYSFSPEKIQKLQQELRDEIDAGFSPGKKRLQFACACAVREGRAPMERFLRYNFTSQNLLFNLGEVNRSAVYYALEIKLTDGNERKAFPYTEIFEQAEKLIVVSGSAGAGKSTMLENIALQFLDPQFGTVPQLKDFQLLVYVQCRDRIIKTLRDVVKQQFSVACSKLGVEMMVEVLKHLRVLFLIDGFDEYDETMKVLEEVMEITWQANCLVIITTRPHALPQLTSLLKNPSSYTTCEIVPLTELEQQMDFLKKYEKHLPGPPAEGSLLEAFKNLDDSVRSSFTEPLKLLRFCDVFVTSPDKISKWTTPNHASKDIFLLYRTLVGKKLINTHRRDLNIVVSDLFQIIAEAAFGFLSSNTLTFTEEQVELIQKKCRLKLKEDHGIQNIDVAHVLSSVLKVEKSLSRTKVITYSFAHKTDEEYFAAQYVVQRIKDSKEPLKEILLGEIEAKMTLPSTCSEEHVPAQARHGAAAEASTPPRPNTCSEEHVPAQARHGAAAEASTPRLFLEVLQFVVQDLGDRDPPLLKARWSQILQALQEAGATFDTWCDLVLSCSDKACVVQSAAQAAHAEGTWELKEGRDVAAVALMLQYAQPSWLVVDMEPDDLRRTCWTDVIRAREGDIWLYLRDGLCDDLIAPLQNSSCRLAYLWGVVTTAESVEVLASVAVPECKLWLTLRGPLDLSALEGKCKELHVYTTPFSIDGNCEIKAPLPAAPLPKLWVICRDTDTWEAVASTVLTLAPRGGRYGAIVSRGDDLTDRDGRMLVATLHQWGIRTEGEGHSRWDRGSAVTRLVLTDTLPDQLAKLDDLIDHVAQCSKRTSWPHQEDWPGQRAVLEAAGADFSTWRDLVLKCSADVRVVKGAAEAALSEDEWCMKTKVWTRPFLVTDDVDARTCLPAQPLPELRVDLTSEDDNWEAVAPTVQTLAPAGGRYEILLLSYVTLSRPDDATLERLVTDLREKGIRTTGEGRTRWKRERGRDWLVSLYILD